MERMIASMQHDDFYDLCSKLIGVMREQREFTAELRSMEEGSHPGTVYHDPKTGTLVLVEMNVPFPCFKKEVASNLKYKVAGPDEATNTRVFGMLESAVLASEFKDLLKP